MLYRILNLAQIFTWSIPSGESVYRNPSPRRKLWWGQKLVITIDFILLEIFAMCTPSAKKSQLKDLMSMTINGSIHKEAGGRADRKESLKYLY